MKASNALVVIVVLELAMVAALVYVCMSQSHALTKSSDVIELQERELAAADTTLYMIVDGYATRVQAME